MHGDPFASGREISFVRRGEVRVTLDRTYESMILSVVFAWLLGVEEVWLVVSHVGRVRCGSQERVFGMMLQHR